MSDSTPSSFITRFLKVMGKLPLPFVRYIGRIVGVCLLRFDRRTRRAIDRNLELCLPNLDREQRARLRNERLAHIGQTFMEMGHMWTKDVSTILKHCRDGDGADRFKEAVAGDGGVIVLAPHIGNWEVLNAYISAIRPLTVMYRPHKNPSLDAFILAARERSGAELAPTNRRGVLQIMKALNASGVVGILPDQVPQKGSGEFAPLFGHRAYTMTLASQLAYKTGAKAFVVGSMQTSKGFEIVAHEVDDRFYSEDTQTSLTGLNASIERLVKVRPGQYQWEYKRFKVQPDGALNLYRENT
ncbi:lipid A biosynthesis acyltransferase [Marinomonas piezotolerans]|uniref:Lipid A biosynthesis acyltransferase n=1 Tax=Marinomonas piezotolerans TaxID=2213058 RepID=A0A370UAV6_9GAMM|nr:lysophospholipid acyltransferase family protein [Marinomonas piezotolerans]RDL44936.1 lipid A biosynthesis acyltransferase [Marinomonas piezotolerans]